MASDSGNSPFFIVGTGAQATLLAHAVTLAGAAPRMIGRSGPIAFKRSLEDGDQRHLLDLPQASPAELRAPAAIFLAVKTYQLEEAVNDHLPRFGAKCPVISTGNGYLEELLGRLQTQHPGFVWRLGLSTFGVSESATSDYALAGKGKIIWGPFKGAVPPSEGEAQLLDAQGNIFSWEPFPRPFCRRKWLFNVVVNSLCAAHRLPRNGDLLSRGDELKQVFDEAFSLGESLFGHWPWDQAELYTALLSLIHATAENENSMARDVRIGRQTETDYLAGLAGRFPGYPKLKELHAILRP